MINTLIAIVSCIVAVIAYRGGLKGNKIMFGIFSKVPYTLYMREDMYLRRPKCVYSLVTVFVDLIYLYFSHEYVIPFLNKFIS